MSAGYFTNYFSSYFNIGTAAAATAAVGAGLPGAIGPKKRPGQVFGEPDPLSPFLTSAAQPLSSPPTLVQVGAQVARSTVSRVDARSLDPPHLRLVETVDSSLIVGVMLAMDDCARGFC